MAKAKWIDLMFEVDDGEQVFVELKTESKTKRELIDEAKQVLKDNDFHKLRFLGFYTEEEAEAIGLDTY
jgi:hypothetical protein